jgi:tetratricopeptide (TPR) repeat protein
LVTFRAAVPQTLVRLLGWAPYIMVYFLAIVVPILLIIGIVKIIPARPEISLSLEDQTAAMPSPAANSAVTEQMRREMDLPKPDRAFRIDTAADDDGSSLGHLRLAVPLRAIEAAFANNAPLSFGPLSINPLQIINIFKPFFRRRYHYELTGAITANGSQTACRVHLDRSRQRVSRRSWEAVGSGADPKSQAIRIVAMQILADLDPGARQITTEWRSLASLREGFELMNDPSHDADTRRKNWERARACFQDAVVIDPGNWLARFNLATIQRKLGFSPLAAEQFRELLDERSSGLPESQRFAVMYNLASALQKTDDDRLSTQALSLLDQILVAADHKSRDGSPIVNPTVARLAKSGKIATWADRLVRSKRAMRRHKQTRDDITRFRANVDRCLADAQLTLDELEREIANDGQNPEENNVVIAVILNALGQLQNLAKTQHEARDSFRRAIRLLPTFLEPQLNLAAAYVEHKGSLDPNWATRAEGLLQNVQNLDGTEPRAAFLLGSLYAHPVFGKTDEAVKQLTLALPSPQAGLRLGSLLLDLGKPADALRPLLSAAEQEPRDSVANYLLALCALRLPADDQRRCRLMDRSARWLQNQIIPAAPENRFHRLLARIQDALKMCPHPKDQAPVGAGAAAD